MVQQVKTKKNWYHVSSSKMSAKAEDTALWIRVYHNSQFTFKGRYILPPLDTIVIVYLMMIRKLNV